MDWQEFIKYIAGQHGLSPEETKTLSFRFPKKDEFLDEQQLAAKLCIGVDAVKKRMQKIYNKFQESCPELAKKDGAGKSGNLQNYLRKRYHQAKGIWGNDVNFPSGSSAYPDEFKFLIEEKIKAFCGRKFVFDAFDQFIKNNSCGYFTVVGDAGMGKSAIAAKYVCDHHAICYFNILAERRNRPELFLKSIRQQLINRYQLQDAGDADLPTLLAKVVQKLPAGERLVIVVDALDEVEQGGTGNLLYLPITLPDQIYFLLTRRPYVPSQKRLFASHGVFTKELDLRKHSDESSHDITEYIWHFLTKEQDGRELLRKWIGDRNLTCEQFVGEVSKKSENNFMYLKYVLPDIARGRYDDLSLDKLPTGLEGYYEDQWHRMNMTSEKIKIVYVMSALRSAVSRPVIAEYSKQNELTVQEVLEYWAHILRKQDQYQPPRYRFYHESFRNFLHRKDIVQAAGISLREISAEVAATITGGIFGDG